MNVETVTNQEEIDEDIGGPVADYEGRQREKIEYTHLPTAFTIVYETETREDIRLLTPTYLDYQTEIDEDIRRPAAHSMDHQMETSDVIRLPTPIYMDHQIETREYSPLSTPISFDHQMETIDALLSQNPISLEHQMETRDSIHSPTPTTINHQMKISHVIHLPTPTNFNNQIETSEDIRWLTPTYMNHQTETRSYDHQRETSEAPYLPTPNLLETREYIRLPLPANFYHPMFTRPSSFPSTHTPYVPTPGPTLPPLLPPFAISSPHPPLLPRDGDLDDLYTFPDAITLDTLRRQDTLPPIREVLDPAVDKTATSCPDLPRIPEWDDLRMAWRERMLSEMTAEGERLTESESGEGLRERQGREMGGMGKRTETENNARTDSMDNSAGDIEDEIEEESENDGVFKIVLALTQRFEMTVDEAIQHLESRFGGVVKEEERERLRVLQAAGVGGEMGMQQPDWDMEEEGEVEKEGGVDGEREVGTNALEGLSA